jgi:diguanylate cyclase (GGDEF)-like protein
MAFDLDFFKKINDRFGHATGDEALKLFATVAAANMRASDYPWSPRRRGVCRHPARFGQ